MDISDQTTEPHPRPSCPLTGGQCSALGDTLQESSNPQLVHLLPHEVLGEFFTLASASTLCVSKRKPSDPLLTVSAVCKRWRRVAIGTKTLWSHVDVNFYECKGDEWFLHISDATWLWLRRAEGAPIHLHFTEILSGHLPMPEFAKTLEPYVTYISALTFSKWHAENTIRDALDLFARHAVLGVLKSVTVYRVTCYKGDGLPFTRPITFLGGLTRLQIGHVSKGIRLNIHQITTILANSPSLRELRLMDIEGTLSNQEDLPVIHLPSLRMINLSYIAEPTLLQLLSILSPGAPDLHVNLRLLCDTDTQAAIRAFLKRSKAVSLTLRREITVLAENLWCLPDLHTLYLDLALGCIPQLSLLVDSTPEGCLIPRYPSIRHMGLLSGTLRPQAQELTKRIVEVYGLMGLSLQGVSWPRTIASLKETFDGWLKNRFGAPAIVDHLYDSDREWEPGRGQRKPWVGQNDTTEPTILRTLPPPPCTAYIWECVFAEFKLVYDR